MIVDESEQDVSSDHVTLFGSIVWDTYQECEQLESLNIACQSSCEFGLEKVFRHGCY